MLRVCDFDFKGGWDVHLPFIEFFYNNRYHHSIKMVRFIALYERGCRSPQVGFEIGEIVLISSDSEFDEVRLIREKLKFAKLGKGPIRIKGREILSSMLMIGSS